VNNCRDAYRKQAAGLFLVSILYALNAILPNTATFDVLDPYNLLVTLSFPLAFLMIFYWVDSSVRAARLTDPLLRDTVHWSRLRFLIWAINIPATLSAFSYATYLQFSAGGLPPSPPLLLLATYLAPDYVSVGSGAVVLLLVVRRTADKTLRRHLEWFGAYLLFILVFAGLIGNGLSAYSVEWSSLVGGASNAAGSYFLYRSAKSLIPIYEFSERETRQAPPPSLEAV
jgi:hypothetical protein